MHEPIYPCLWFDGQAQEAAKYYCTVFPDSRIISTNPMVTIFELRGKHFMALNGGPHFKFNEAVSLVIDCRDQAEVDHYWNSLTAEGGKESQCGWLKDKYGLSWQVVPAVLGQLMGNPAKAGKVMPVLLKMKKLIVADLVAAGE
jgi:predicted 3-demethylubiquinone-9 3-methyltransferase (glyoxalase superfamily)